MQKYNKKYKKPEYQTLRTLGTRSKNNINNAKMYKAWEDRMMGWKEGGMGQGRK